MEKMKRKFSFFLLDITSFGFSAVKGEGFAFIPSGLSPLTASPKAVLKKLGKKKKRKKLIRLNDNIPWIIRIFQGGRDNGYA